MENDSLSREGSALAAFTPGLAGSSQDRFGLADSITIQARLPAGGG